MVTPLHHHLKLNGATPRTGRPLFWVITPFMHTPICVPTEKARPTNYFCVVHEVDAMGLMAALCWQVEHA